MTDKTVVDYVHLLPQPYMVIETDDSEFETYWFEIVELPKSNE